MTDLRVTKPVCAAFPGLRIAAVVADGFDGNTAWPEVEAALGGLGAAALEAAAPEAAAN
jgi:hypothetical protein